MFKCSRTSLNILAVNLFNICTHYNYNIVISNLLQWYFTILYLYENRICAASALNINIYTSRVLDRSLYSTSNNNISYAYSINYYNL